MSEDVDEQLDGEDGGEGRVEGVEDILDVGGGAVLVEEPLSLELCLDDGRAEVLRAGVRDSLLEFGSESGAVANYDCSTAIIKKAAAP